MTTQIVAAPAGTNIVEIKPGSSRGFVRYPVIAFRFDGTTSRCDFLTLDGEFRLLPGIAVEFANRIVQDPRFEVPFETAESWAEVAHRAPKITPAQPEAADTAESPDEESVSARPGSLDIEWTTKSYKTNSWWHYDDGSFEFLMQVEGETPAPLQTSKMTKIKRTEFMEMKKKLDVFDRADLESFEPLEVATEEEETATDYDDFI